jgi:hypothetical protein
MFAAEPRRSGTISDAIGSCIVQIVCGPVHNEANLLCIGFAVVPRTAGIEDGHRSRR